MPSTSIALAEADVIKLILEFLNNRDLNISMLSLERETGLINGAFSDDMLFLRQLILDGQWDDAIDFVQPINTTESFNFKHFQYTVLKHKYLELLCIKSEPGPMQNSEFTVDEVVTCLNSLEQFCPSKEDYSNLCLLLTLPRLSDHVEYQNWNPSNGRMQCFKEVFPLVKNFLVVDKKSDIMNMSKNDRLLQLLLKGLLYESCVEFCQYKATSSEYDCKDMKIATLMKGTTFGDADLSLLSWLQAVPQDIFSCPFEQKSLNMDIKPLMKPSLEASWSEQILVTPIKPKMFPYSAIPSSRPRSAEFMSRSLNPQYDGLSYGLGLGRRESTGSPGHDLSLMSRSFAGFHLNTKKGMMHTSVDKIFEDSDKIDTQSSIIEEGYTSQDKVVPEKTPVKSVPSPSESPKLKSRMHTVDTTSPRQSNTSPEHGYEKKSIEQTSVDSSMDLYREYQKQKQRLQEELEQKERQRLQYQRELMNETQITDNRYIDNNRNNSMNNKSHMVNAPGECVFCIVSPHILYSQCFIILLLVIVKM